MAQLWMIITSIVDENCASSSVDLSFRDLQSVCCCRCCERSERCHRRLSSHSFQEHLNVEGVGDKSCCWKENSRRKELEGKAGREGGNGRFIISDDGRGKGGKSSR